MKIKQFSEKEIRRQILNKVEPRITSKGKHWKGSIYCDDKLIAKVKIPNEHNRVMYEKKSRYIARDLRLDENQFNNLIECPLSKEKYYAILRKFI